MDDRCLQEMVVLESDGPTYATTASFDVVLKSTGAVMALVDQVVAESQVSCIEAPHEA